MVTTITASPVRRSQDAAPDDYAKLASKLGIRTKAVVKAELEAILADECIGVYGIGKVREYMDEICRKENGRLNAQVSAALSAIQSNARTVKIQDPDGTTREAGINKPTTTPAAEPKDARPSISMRTVGDFGVPFHFDEMVPVIEMSEAAMQTMPLPMAQRLELLHRGLRTARSAIEASMIDREIARIMRLAAEQEAFRTKASFIVPSAALSLPFPWDWDRTLRGNPATITWNWHPLRKQDKKAIDNGSPVYKHPVPMPVLMTIEKICDRMPDAAFFVTDYEVKDPDPFLLVTHKELGIEGGYVIERWDEPSFRG